MDGAWRRRKAEREAAGWCRDCGGEVEDPGAKYCRRHKARRNQAHRARQDRQRVEVRLRLPRALHALIEADAAERGESVEAWLEAEARAAPARPRRAAVLPGG